MNPLKAAKQLLHLDALGAEPYGGWATAKPACPLHNVVDKPVFLQFHSHNVT